MVFFAGDALAKDALIAELLLLELNLFEPINCVRWGDKPHLTCEDSIGIWGCGGVHSEYSLTQSGIDSAKSWIQLKVEFNFFILHCRYFVRKEAVLYLRYQKDVGISHYLHIWR